MAKHVATVPSMTENVFMVTAIDSPGSAAVRDEYLEQHLEYVERNHERYLVCGPMRNPGERQLTGSFFVLAHTSEEEVMTFLMGDPYFSQGIYQSVDVKSISPAAGRWMGGVIWESAETIRARVS